MPTSWREQLAWAAGFYDGEGCCSMTTVSSYRVSIPQNDPAVLLKFQDAVLGLGSITGPYQTPSMGNSKPRWQFQASGSAAQAIIAMLWFELSDIKRAQATRCLTAGSFAPPTWRGDNADDPRLCRAGHPYAGNRTKAGQCRPCMRETDRKRVRRPH